MVVSFLAALGLVVIGVVVGVIGTVYWTAKNNGRNGDQPLPPYDDEEGWK